MARLPRLNLPGIPQHVVQRGNNRQVCFFAEQDYTVYLSKLKEYSQKYKVAVHSYILMTNHVHLLLTPEEGDGVSRLIQSLGRYYVRYVNQTYGRSGTLWEGRYKSTLVDSDNYFLTVSRYIELNSDDTTPSLHVHYTPFVTTTGRSAPVPRIGTLALAGSPLGLLPSHRGDRSPGYMLEPETDSRHLNAGRRSGSKRIAPELVPVNDYPRF